MVADIVGWTPLGAVFGVSASAAQNVVTAALRLVIALATVFVLWFASQRLLAARLVSPIQSSGGGRVRSGGLLDRMLPANSTGAVAARSLRYFRRDPRQLVNIVMLFCLLPAIFIGIALMNNLQEEAIGFAPAITLIPAINALLAGTIVQMAIAYDNDAVAMHILTGVTGSADRAGRPARLRTDRGTGHGRAVRGNLPALAGRPDLLPGSLGASLGLTAIAAGAGAWVGSFLPGRAPAPEANPFGRGSSGGGAVALLAMIIIGESRSCSVHRRSGRHRSDLESRAGVDQPRLRHRLRRSGALGRNRARREDLDRRWPEVLADVSSES